jgi:alpha/beta superfamily hydrolase
LKDFIETPVTFESDGLRLQGALHTGTGPLAAIVMHPHPQYGGDMHSHVVMTLCRAIAAFDATTLRFNFRGAGSSEGAHDGGRGEATDARAAVEYVRQRVPGAPLVLAGYSFGAGIAADVAASTAPLALVLASPPAPVADRGLPEGTPALIVTGGRDPVAPAGALRRLEGQGRELVVVDDADHFWFPGADRLSEAVAGFLRNLPIDQ